MPDPILNVFEHQRFRLRRPDGTRVSKSFREILTEPDAAFALDYAQTFYDVAALGLMAYLAQVAFEPPTAGELARRIEAPMTDADFEVGVSRLRDRFALTGEGPRFMQAPAPFDAKKNGKPISDSVFITSAKPNATQVDRRFLHRTDDDWAIAPDQSSLFLFAANYFMPGTLGGHKKGVHGDQSVRVFVTDPTEADTVWLRRTLWLNVLARDQQRQYVGAFGTREAGDYDDLFWANPPKRDVPIGGITLQAGMGWMSDYHWLRFEEGAEGICAVTGLPISGRLAKTFSKKSTRIGYGTGGDLGSGVRASRLFRHPNVPTQRFFDRKTGDVTGEQPFLVQRTEGLAAAIGAVFFGGRDDRSDVRYVLAPVVSQLYAGPLQDLGLATRLRVFGFHMLSGQKNVHGGIEQSAADYAPVVPDGPDAELTLEVAAALMGRAADYARSAAEALGQAVQRTVGAGVRASVNAETGAIKVASKLLATPSVDDPFGRDTLAAFWRAAEALLTDHAGRVARAAAGGSQALAAARESLQAAWEDAVTAEARRQYAPVFDHYATLARTMPYAHTARAWFYTNLKNARSTASEPQPDAA